MICIECGAEFTPRQGHAQKYCGDKCRTRVEHRKYSASRRARLRAEKANQPRCCQRCGADISSMGRKTRYCLDCVKGNARKPGTPQPAETGQQRINRQRKASNDRIAANIERVVEKALQQGKQTHTSAEHIDKWIRGSGCIRCRRVG